MENLGKSPVVSKHQAMYKGATPPWKETYRKRCKDRLKKSREKFLNRFRGVGDMGSGAACQEAAPSTLIHDLMVDEWKTLRTEQGGLPPFDIEMDTSEVAHVDDAMRIFEDIRQELLREEQQILAEYEAAQGFDEDAIASTLQVEHPDFVVCPVCQKSQLLMHNTVIICKCGLRIETEQDSITLGHLKRNLQEGLHLHSETCQGVPVFSTVNQVGVTNLIMTCQNCDMWYIVV